MNVSDMEYQANNLSQMKEANKRASEKGLRAYWFEAGAMRFFATKLYPNAVFPSAKKGFTYFVSSEQGPDKVRRFSVRRFDWRTAKVDTLGDFGGFRTLESAKDAAKRIGAGEYYEDVIRKNPSRAKRKKGNLMRKNPSAFIVVARGHGARLFFDGKKFTTKGRSKVFGSMARARSKANELANKYRALDSYGVFATAYVPKS